LSATLLPLVERLVTLIRLLALRKKKRFLASCLLKNWQRLLLRRWVQRLFPVCLVLVVLVVLVPGRVLLERVALGLRVPVLPEQGLRV
jgi:hypothetical protein